MNILIARFEGNSSKIPDSTRQNQTKARVRNWFRWSQTLCALGHHATYHWRPRAAVVNLNPLRISEFVFQCGYYLDPPFNSNRLRRRFHEASGEHNSGGESVK